MFFKFLGIVVIMFLLFVAYMRFPPAPARISQPVTAYNSQYEIFRDMEPDTQTRVNPWMDFLQEDVYKRRTGPIGDFIGKEDAPKKAPLYMVT
jgi:hypothetical protein